MSDSGRPVPRSQVPPSPAYRSEEPKSALIWALVSIPLAASVSIPFLGPFVLTPLFVVLVVAASPFGTSRGVALLLAVASATLTWLPLFTLNQWLIIPLCAPADWTAHTVAAGVAAFCYLVLAFVAGRYRLAWLWTAAALALVGSYLATYVALGGLSERFYC